MIQAFLFDHNDIPALLTVAGGLFVASTLFAVGYVRSAHAAWVAVICLVSFPFESFQTHAHLDKIGWIPFYSWPVRPLDIVGNIVLYVPLGFLATTPTLARPFATKTPTTSLARTATKTRKHTRAPYLLIGAEAFLLSLTMEVIQDFSHSRFPSATDLVCNVAGAVVGTAFAGWWVSSAEGA